MKKILIATLILAIFIAFTVYANASSSRITIRSAEELAEMRRMIEAPIEELAEYVRKSFPTEVFTSRQDIISFLELLDSLPIPHEEGMYFSSLTYYPFSNNQTFDISFRNKTGEIHSFRLFAGGDNGKGIFENSSNGESLVEIYRGQDNERQIIVYSPPSAWGD
ncbi:MAG: hypothetical protein LBC86_04210, partial [Oscillospiraceae bacterium]|nr:hypothetical protein [Oscillospiraceae bacterium]